MPNNVYGGPGNREQKGGKKIYKGTGAKEGEAL